MASKARLVITAVVVEGRSPAEVARTYGVARSWVYTLVGRYRTEGDTAFEARSRRPKRSPNATDDATIALILELRGQLTEAGLDAGPDTIRWHLEHHHRIRVHPATIYRILQRHGLISPAPEKRPRSSYIRFEAELPNECWQSDFMHYPLVDGTDTEILSPGSMTTPATRCGSARTSQSPAKSSATSSALRQQSTESPRQR